MRDCGSMPSVLTNAALSQWRSPGRVDLCHTLMGSERIDCVRESECACRLDQRGHLRGVHDRFEICTACSNRVAPRDSSITSCEPRIVHTQACESDARVESCGRGESGDRKPDRSSGSPWDESRARDPRGAWSRALRIVTSCLQRGSDSLLAVSSAHRRTSRGTRTVNALTVGREHSRRSARRSPRAQRSLQNERPSRILAPRGSLGSGRRNLSDYANRSRACSGSGPRRRGRAERSSRRDRREHPTGRKTDSTNHVRSPCLPGAS